ncbi:hypothetical protein NAP1_07145 [Erythrobacter sp. NAP1]|uniref:ATP-binding protein n=1 Tax=Erythrobacter sp. NAP1 TaxID=237727 RepID=UPI00006869F6|nr:ATP-binding protein [Erythrobacter sp. NAP1]EAQ30535.1 hypothetical protein NAP1_07145 [Erythrobacter sp. NAP1]
MRQQSERLTANQVFGVKKAYELINYIERRDVDDLFIDSLQNGKHVSLYGASKTGKSSLIERHVGRSERLYIQCLHAWTYEQFIDALLNVAYGRTEQISETEEERVNEKNARANLGASSGDFRIDVGGSNKKTHTQIIRTIDSRKYDLLNPGDMLRFFEELGYGRDRGYDENLYIVVDDFHQLSEHAQTKIANTAKMLFDNANVVFICVGIWAEEQKLASLCTELLGRCVEINCNVWTKTDLVEVVENGAAMLNLTFPDGFAESVAKESCGSVFIVQEACSEACRQVGVSDAPAELLKVTQTLNASTIVRRVADRHCNFTDFHNKLMGFCRKERQMPALYIYRLVLKLYASSRGLFTSRQIQSKIESDFQDYRFNDLFAREAMHTLREFLYSQNFTSIIDIYSDNRNKFKLSLVDKTFTLWLRGRKNELLADVDERIHIHQRLSRSERGVKLG